MSARPRGFLAEAGAEQTERMKKPTAPEPTVRRVRVSADVTPAQRDALATTAARHRLSVSSLVATIAVAAEQGNEALDLVLSEHANESRRQRGGAR